MTDTEIQTFIRYIWAMSLVPKRKIIKVWEDFIIENQLEADEEDNEEAVQFDLALESGEDRGEGVHRHQGPSRQ